MPRWNKGLEERFLDKIQRDQETGCWLWQANRNRDGYGAIKVDGKYLKAHRVAYELYRGQIPDGLHIDHLCSNRRCVNPYHLEPVTMKENRRRTVARGLARNANTYKTHCKRGHELAGENLRIYPSGARICRACLKIQYAARQAAKGYRGNFNAQKMVCKRGHALDGENLYIGPDGKRQCRTCMRDRRLATCRRQEQRAEVALF